MRYLHPRRVVLLLATKNADKPDVEAEREDRVTMMKGVGRGCGGGPGRGVGRDGGERGGGGE